MPTDRSQDLMGTDLVGLSGSAPAVTTLPSVPAQPTGSALLEELVPPSRAEVQQRVNALYDRAESDTGTFNATRAMASGARRGSPAGRTSDADVSAVARQWFDSARSAFGPIVPAVLPRDRTPERPAVAPRPPRAVEPAGTRELESAERHVPELTARTLPALPPASSADGLRASHDDGIELQGARALSPAPAAASARAGFPPPTAPAPEPLPAEPAWDTGQLPTYGTGAVTWGTQDTGMMTWGAQGTGATAWAAQDAGATAWAAQDAGTTAWGGQDAGAATGQTGGMQDSGSMQWAAPDMSATTWGAQDTGTTAWATQATQDTGAMTWGLQETGAHNWDALRMGTTPWAAQDTGGFSAPSALTDTGVYASPSALTDTGAYAVPSPLMDTGGFATPLPLTDTGSFAAPFALTDTGGFAAPSALTDTSGYAVPSAAPDAVGFTTAPATVDPVPAAPVAPATVGSSPAAPVHTAKADKAVAFARAQLGKPCVWGAKGPGSYDCSGLTQAAWTAAGLPLPRATADQAGAGTPVELADLRPGDLIFFFDGLRHTGLYTGDGLMIHAPGPGAFVSEESIFHAGEDAIRCAVRPA
ncbi:NlpC/P60 family protein [Streptomyces longwoodensis]|uniref:NlpC/P60 family protein n=1 Tax=Streptomyces longwoodensis TaxID=68231 RepID=UPI0033FBCB09